MHLEKLCPVHPCLAALRCGVYVVTTQDVPHGQLVDVMPEICHSALNATVTPGRVFLGHTHDELLHLCDNTWSSQLSALLAPVKLLGDQSLVPAQERVWGGERSDLLQARAAEGVGQRSKPLA